ncbi:MAG: hypothetical protein V4619_07490, partial [Bacteroidota bacterium]
VFKSFGNARTEYDHSVGNNLKVGNIITGNQGEFGNILSSGIVYIGTKTSSAYTLQNNLTLNTVRNIGYGSIGQIEAGSTGTYRYFYSLINMDAGATPGTVYGMEARKGGFGAGATMGTMIGFGAQSTFVNTTGDTYLYNGPLAASANVWHIYANGTAQSYHNGYFGFGVSTPTARADIAAPSTTVPQMRLRSGPQPTTQVAGYLGYTSPDLLFTPSGTTAHYVMLGTAKPTSAQFPVSNGTNYTPVSMGNDATMSNTGALTLKNTGTPGTYRSVTVDAQGRVTAGTNPSTFDSNAPQTTVAGSTSGNVIASMPFQGTSYKKVVIRVNSFDSPASREYTYPTVFTNAPVVTYGFSSGTLNFINASTTSVFMQSTGGAATGWVVLEGY